MRIPQLFPMSVLIIVGCTSGSGSSPCPASTPAAGAPCTPPAGSALACEYGGDAHGNCTTVAQCVTQTQGTALHWMVTPPYPSCGQQPAQCPATLSAVPQGTLCTANVVACDYPEGRCGCVPCRADGGEGAMWHCNAWSSIVGCPKPHPNLGSACGSEGKTCDYDFCCSGPSLGPDMQCSGGYWSRTRSRDERRGKRRNLNRKTGRQEEFRIDYSSLSFPSSCLPHASPVA